MAKAKCGTCDAQFEDPNDGQLPRLPCPICGSTACVLVVAITEKVQVHETLGFKYKRPGYKKPIAEGTSGADFSRKLGKYVNKARLIDRLNNRYREQVTDPETGQSIHSWDEPLDQHRGHGSAKPKR